jgi:hypothetical protein
MKAIWAIVPGGRRTRKQHPVALPPTLTERTLEAFRRAATPGEALWLWPSQAASRQRAFLV